MMVDRNQWTAQWRGRQWLSYGRRYKAIVARISDHVWSLEG
jgi:hypothetical protein